MSQTSDCFSNSCKCSRTVRQFLLYQDVKLHQETTWHLEISSSFTQNNDICSETVNSFFYHNRQKPFSISLRLQSFFSLNLLFIHAHPCPWICKTFTYIRYKGNERVTINVSRLPTSTFSMFPFKAEPLEAILWHIWDTLQWGVEA